MIRLRVWTAQQRRSSVSWGQVSVRRARANVLTPEERSEIARRAVAARWIKAGNAREITGDAASPPAPEQVETRGPEELPYMADDQDAAVDPRELLRKIMQISPEDAEDVRRDSPATPARTRRKNAGGPTLS